MCGFVFRQLLCRPVPRLRGRDRTPRELIDRFSLRRTCAAVKPPDGSNALQTVSFLEKTPGFLNQQAGMALPRLGFPCQLHFSAVVPPVAQALGETAAAKFLKNWSANFFAVPSISRAPNCAILPPTLAETS
jgi:hypothetical protein